MARPHESIRVRLTLLFVLSAIVAVGWFDLFGMYDNTRGAIGVALVVAVGALVMRCFEDVALAFGFAVVLFGAKLLFPHVDEDVLLLRTAAISAFVLLHLVLLIGPWSWWVKPVMRAYKHRRHMGVTVFLLGLLHYVLVMRVYFDRNPLLAWQGGAVIFLGYSALMTFFFLAMTSHDRAQRRFSERTWRILQTFLIAGYACFMVIGARMTVLPYPWWVWGLGGLAISWGLLTVRAPWSVRLIRPFFGWKQLHRMIYVAYAFLLAHAGLVATTSAPLWVRITMIGGAAFVIGSHVVGQVMRRRQDRWAKERVTRVARTLERDGQQFVGIAKVDEFHPGIGQKFVVSGRVVAVFKIGQRFVALSNTCMHQQGPISKGWVDSEEYIVCPWHEWQYSSTDGCGPPEYRKDCVPLFPTIIEEGIVFVSLTRQPLPVDVPQPARAAGDL